MVKREALQVALEVFRSPTLARAAQSKPLPPNVLQVIRIAAGESLERTTLDLTFGWTDAEVKAAAVFYLQQTLFAKNADDFRLLGLHPGADEVDIKDHKRALLKWLHPDLNANKWESVLIQRVIKASDNIIAKANQPSIDQVDQAKLMTLGMVHRRSSKHRLIRDQIPDTKRIRKLLYWREHLISFAKRVSILLVVLTIALIGVRMISVSDSAENFFGLARDMLARVD